uniref:Uncharacterized protein n=1 Tax=Moniliophthora roreri TaxID=221103 RepID=A0A0W0FDL4_MONRR
MLLPFSAFLYLWHILLQHVPQSPHKLV